jgi:Ca2+-binding RTX toxin-like protein
VFKRCLTNLFRSRRRPARRNHTAVRSLGLESLDHRVLPAVTASFSAQAGILTVFGDSLSNTITVSRNAAGNILVNGGAVAVLGGTSTVANTSLIQVFGQGGNDTIALSEINGALPRANLFGGADNDTLTGGSGAD